MIATETITWIDVNSQLPDSDILVLVATPSPGEPVWPGYFDSAANEWMISDGLAFAYKVTHWGEWLPHSHGAISDRGKQWGTLDRHGNFCSTATPWNGHDDDGSGEAVMVGIGTKLSGRFLDGFLHDEFPQVQHAT
jgi:hypothetical protein